jgi:hypothetical protein
MSSSVGIFASQISGHLFTLQGSYDALASVTVPSGGVSSVTFAGIPTGYSHLQLRVMYLPNNSGYSIKLTFNGDTGNNYTTHTFAGNGSTTGVYAGTNLANIYSALATYGGQSGIPTAVITDILDYSNTNKLKTIKSFSGVDNNGAGTIELGSGLWFKAGTGVTSDAINSITITGQSINFNQYSSFALYGVK